MDYIQQKTDEILAILAPYNFTIARSYIDNRGNKELGIIIHKPFRKLFNEIEPALLDLDLMFDLDSFVNNTSFLQITI